MLGTRHRETTLAPRRVLAVLLLHQRSALSEPGGLGGLLLSTRRQYGRIVFVRLDQRHLRSPHIPGQKSQAPSEGACASSAHWIGERGSQTSRAEASRSPW
jgi:hypothetical protein